MTHVLTLPPRSWHRPRLQSALIGLIERHGRWRVVRAALFARPSQKLRSEDLTPHMRRDLNLHAPSDSLPSARQHLL